MDAFPDFIDRFHVVTPLVQQMFNAVRESIQQKKEDIVSQIIDIMNLNEAQQEEGELSVRDVLHSKF